MSTAPEVWLRGPVPAISAYLQPVAHSLMQCRQEVLATVSGLTEAELWSRPANAACVAFHARHAIGSLDRLLTYARGEQLSSAQLEHMEREGESGTGPTTGDELVAAFEAAVERALAQLRAVPETDLLTAREVGRARLPSTVLGLLVHAAEHTQRHVGQLVTTARIVRGIAVRHG